MHRAGKHISGPSSTGGLGNNFETRVQASFVVLMLTGGVAPCLPTWPIKKIKLQGKYQGYDTDDLIVFSEPPSGHRRARLIGQIKHTIRVTEKDKEFAQVVQAAWNDFNNPDVFEEDIDIIALITGPLGATTTDSTRGLLQQAQHSENSADFIKRVELVRFTPKEQVDRLSAFRTHLRVANGNLDVPNDQLWRFLKSFRLLIYDLDIKGVTLSLLHSLIGHHHRQSPEALWSRIKDEVEWQNQHAGSITIESIPPDIRAAFQKARIEEIPSEIAGTTPPREKESRSGDERSSELAIANLLGSWNEKHPADVQIAAQLANEDYSVWISKVREILLQPQSPLSLKNGVWKVSRRQELWQTLGRRLFDDQLGRFEQCIVTVLRERDPQFDLPPKERYTASIYGKALKHSHDLRTGLAESLALLGSHPQDLINCSTGNAERTAALSVKRILDEADWVLWGSLNDILPLMAEAAPEAFLGAVEEALQQTPCPFDELFAQEGDGLTGGNYLTGLLWALEALAWDQQFLVRASIVLGELASHDPGGNWANRPANSLTTIFLPWFPQTTATIAKRKAALQNLLREAPGVAWRLLLSLLPNQHQITSGSHKPVWRATIPQNWSEGVTQEEYWDQVASYADMIVEMAKKDMGKLDQLVGQLDNLPPSSFNKLADYIASSDITARPESERIELWMDLVKVASKHKRFAGAKWALGADFIARLDDLATRLAPTNPLNLHRRLFSGDDFDLYEREGDWQQQQQQLAERRRQAIRVILDYAGIDGVIQFAEEVESPWNVGSSLAFVAESQLDTVLLPNLLQAESKNLVQFADGFVTGRYQCQGWAWVDKIDMTGWSRSQIGLLLLCLPFAQETWKRSQELLGDSDTEYWSKVTVNPYQANGDIRVAVDKLISHGRPHAAINCLHKMLYDRQPLDRVRAVRALLSAVSSAEPSYDMDQHHILEMIKALQNDTDTSPDDLIRVEWAYLPILDEHHDAAPNTLEQRLATDPSFFCEVIRLVYRSKKEPKSHGEPTEQQKAIAANAYRLLSEWRTPPGRQIDGGFSQDRFRRWLESVRAICTDSGHIEVALTHVGSVLSHCPPDPDGLWIDRAAAEALNGKDAEAMRDGFTMAIANSRGSYWVDPTGKPELELAEKYRQQAEEVENAGYQRLATALRGLADSYTDDAKRIIDEHEQESGSDS